MLAVELVTGRAATSSARRPTSTPSCSGRCAAAAATSASSPPSSSPFTPSDRRSSPASCSTPPSAGASSYGASGTSWTARPTSSRSPSRTSPARTRTRSRRSCAAAPPSPSSACTPGPAQIFIPAWGGAVARVPEGATPLAKRDARYVVHPLLLWEDAAEDERMIAFGRRYRDVLAAYRTGGTYLNFLGEEGADRVRAAYGPNHERLARVKAGWDPDNVFRATGNVQRPD